MNPKNHTLSVEAKVDNLYKVIDFINQSLNSNICSISLRTHIDVAVEEIFINIAHYAYPDGSGEAEICAEVNANNVGITFIDSGVPYNPLEKPDPDITLSADKRAIGGLGIYMTKKLMDDVRYEYSGGKNILKIKKHLS